MSRLDMSTPIWLWLYDYGALAYPHVWHHSDHTKHFCHPQAHAYAFKTEEEALAHPKQVNWPKDHNYILQKVYLQ